MSLWLSSQVKYLFCYLLPGVLRCPPMGQHLWFWEQLCLVHEATCWKEQSLCTAGQGQASCRDCCSKLPCCEAHNPRVRWSFPFTSCNSLSSSFRDTSKRWGIQWSLCGSEYLWVILWPTVMQGVNLSTFTSGLLLSLEVLGWGTIFKQYLYFGWLFCL